MKWSNLTEQQFKRILLVNGDNESVAEKKIEYVKDYEIYLDKTWDQLYDYIMELEISTFCGCVEEREHITGVDGFDKPCRSCMN